VVLAGLPNLQPVLVLQVEVLHEGKGGAGQRVRVEMGVGVGDDLRVADGTIALWLNQR